MRKHPRRSVCACDPLPGSSCPLRWMLIAGGTFALRSIFSATVLVLLVFAALRQRRYRECRDSHPDAPAEPYACARNPATRHLPSSPTLNTTVRYPFPIKPPLLPPPLLLKLLLQLVLVLVFELIQVFVVGARAPAERTATGATSQPGLCTYVHAREYMAAFSSE
jgi:hypothetical protein